MDLETKAARDAINLFVANRKPSVAVKISGLDKKIADEKHESQWQELIAKREQLIEQHGNQMREEWIDDNAKNARQITRVTHADKYVHPDIKDTDRVLFSDECDDARAEYLGTHSLAGETLDFDFVRGGQYAGLSAFLRVLVGDHRIADSVRSRDPTLVAALTDDNDQGRAWLDQLSCFEEGRVCRSTDTRAKQIYFPVGDRGYHVVAPSFPTSLAHALYVRLRAAQFSGEAKEARKARREGKQCDHGYADYPELAVQKFGGTKPQNISQLNSERHGEAWLLAAVPPVWRSPAVRPPLGVKTLFGPWFGRRRAVSELTQALADFLTRTDYNNVNMRRARERMVDQIVDELVQVAAELHELDPGWSAAGECKLNSEEMLWLDPGRAADDESFAQALAQTDSPEQIAERFGKWLNAEVRYRSRKSSRKRGELPLGDPEQDAWKTAAEKALRMLDTEVGHG